MNYFKLLVLSLILLTACEPAPAATNAPATEPVPSTRQVTLPSASTITPQSSPTILATETQLPVKFLISQIRKPADTDGRQILTAFWSEDDSKVYYALVNEIPDPAQWFAITLDGDGSVQEDKKLPSHPKIIHTPLIQIGGIYSEYQGQVSPTGRYHFKIIGANDYSLYLIDTVKKSKVKLLETNDMNFRNAFWTPDEKIVAFAIGPEFGTEKYLYNVGERKLITFEELIGFDDPSIFQWSLSPDGKNILMANDERLMIFPLENGKEIKIDGAFGNVRWSGNGERIYFYRGTRWDNLDTIGYFDLATKSMGNIAKIPVLENLGGSGAFDVSQEGTRLVFWDDRDLWLLTLR
jgi:hypothetical protein